MKWTSTSLDAVSIKIGSGSTPTGGSKSYKDQGTPFIRSMNVRDGLFEPSGMVFLSDAQASLLNNVILEEDDVLLNITGASVARVCRLPARYSGGRVNQHVSIIRPDPDQLSSAYLAHYLLLPPVKDRLLRISESGATREAITKAAIAEFRIPVPPISDQRRIAAILDEADALRAKRRAALAQLDEMARAIFVEMFGDVRLNTLGWESTQVLGDVAEVASGITKGRKLPAVPVRSVPYLAVANVQDRALDLTKTKQIDASEDEIARYRLQPNDLVLTEGGDPDKLGRGVLWRSELPECIHQNHIFRVRLTENAIHPLFLNWLVGSEHGKAYFLRSAKQTTGIASINMSQLRAFPLRVPPFPLQETFAKRLGQLARLRLMAERSAATLDSLFASLQHRAFTGEL